MTQSREFCENSLVSLLTEKEDHAVIMLAYNIGVNGRLMVADLKQSNDKRVEKKGDGLLCTLQDTSMVPSLATADKYLCKIGTIGTDVSIHQEMLIWRLLPKADYAEVERFRASSVSRITKRPEEWLDNFVRGDGSILPKLYASVLINGKKDRINNEVAGADEIFKHSGVTGGAEDHNVTSTCIITLQTVPFGQWRALKFSSTLDIMSTATVKVDMGDQSWKN